MGHPDFHDKIAYNSIQSSHFIMHNTQRVHFAHETLTYRKKNGVFLLDGSYFRAHNATWRNSHRTWQATQPATKGPRART